MKKISLCVTAACMACMLAVTGCGAKVEEVVFDSEMKQVQPLSEEDNLKQSNSEEQSTSEEGNASTDASEQVQGLKVPQLVIEKKLEERFTEDHKLLMSSSYETVSVENGFEALAQTVKLWSDKNEEGIFEQTESLANLSKDDEYVDINYSIEEYVTVNRIDSKVLSFNVFSYSYTGGAHGNYGSYGHVYDVETGAKLELYDVLSTQDGFREAANEYICKELEEEYGEGLFPEYGESLSFMWENAFFNWYMSGTGIVLIFNPYEIGPYAMGQVTVELPYSEFASFIKEEYFANIFAGVSCLTLDTVANLPDGHTVSVTLSEPDEYEEISVIINTDKGSADEGKFYRIENAYLVNREDNRSFIIFSADYASDDFKMYVYEVTGGNIKKTDEQYGISFNRGCINTQGMVLSKRVDVLGTYSAFAGYTLDENGSLVRRDEMYEIPASSYEWYILTTKEELPVTIDGKDELLPVGTRLRVVETDDSSRIHIWLLDAERDGIITYTRGSGEYEWGCFINGIQDNEYFESLPYAG